MYEDQLENMLCQHVLPQFSSPHGHMRARVSRNLSIQFDFRNLFLLGRLMKIYRNLF